MRANASQEAVARLPTPPVSLFLNVQAPIELKTDFLLSNGSNVMESAQMKQWLVVILALGALIIGYRQLIMEKFLGWFVTHDAIPVTAAPVNKALLPHVVRGRGQLQAFEVVDVVSPVAGQLSKVELKVGDKVAKGQTLATVRSGELLQRMEKIAATLEAATADLRQKDSRLAEAEKALERAHELYSRDLIPGRDLKELEAARDAARAQRALTYAQVAEQQAALEQTRFVLTVSKLVAPFNGVVTRILAESGAYVQTSMPVFSVGAMEPLKVMIEIPETDLDFVREGVAAQVRADALPDRAFEGQVTLVQSKLEKTQRVVAEVELSNRDRLLVAGMNVEVVFAQKNGQ
jgi:RND family efflux transporter MFP subunit